MKRYSCQGDEDNGEPDEDIGRAQNDSQGGETQRSTEAPEFAAQDVEGLGILLDGIGGNADELPGPVAEGHGRESCL